MLPTVADILALPVLQAGRPEVIGGGSLDRPVRWVHVSDLPDLSNLLNGGELVLTTGRSLVDDPTSYLRRLSQVGAVGVIVELGDLAISAEVTVAADRLTLPVILLHEQIRFVEVTETVHRSIVAEQYDELAFARRAHEIFTEMSMRRANLGEIIDAATAMLDAPVVLEDLNRQVLAYNAHERTAADLLTNWERRSRLTPVTANTTVSGPEGWTTTPVGAHRQTWGRLVAPIPIGHDPRARLAIERAAQALSLHRMVEQSWAALEQQAQTGLVEDLRRGRIPNEAEATARASALGLSATLSYIPMTVRVLESTTADQVLAQSRRARTLDSVQHAVRAAHRTALISYRPTGQIDLLLSHSAGDSLSSSLTEVALAIRSALARLDGVVRCTIGVGPTSGRLIDVALGLAESAHVADVALSLPHHDREFHTSADIRLRGLVALIRNDPRVQAFAEAELRGLLDHHARHGGDHIDVLRQFLKFSGNKTELAHQLHISRPTLYSKIAVIQRLLGVDLDDAESRASLHTAMLIIDSPPVPLSDSGPG